MARPGRMRRHAYARRRRGAGVVGSAVALRLAQRRRAGRPCSTPASRERATSSTSFAWIGASAAALRDYRALNVAGVEAYARMEAELGPRPWLRRTGSLVWHTDPERCAELASQVAALTDMGYAAALLDPEQALALEPVAAPRTGGRARRVPRRRGARRRAADGRGARGASRGCGRRAAHRRGGDRGRRRRRHPRDGRAAGRRRRRAVRRPLDRLRSPAWRCSTRPSAVRCRSGCS